MVRVAMRRNRREMNFAALTMRRGLGVVVTGLMAYTGLLPVVAAGRAEATGNVVFFGDSLAAGYGLDDPSAESFPGVIAARIQAAKLPFAVVNAGLSGETTAAGARRANWV